jgi:nucleoside triphosphate pyrophosphatase
MTELILASTSPRRHELLKQLGRPFRIIPPTADETVPPGMTCTQVAESLARLKARSVAESLTEGIVLGADTLVTACLDATTPEEIIGKPRDRAHAIAILEALSAHPHHVITGVCLIDATTGREIVSSDSTAVTMHPMTRVEIEEYVDSGEAMGKAGAYAIQETGDRFVARMEGSLSNVVGLPLEHLTQLLEEMEQTES